MFYNKLFLGLGLFILCLFTGCGDSGVLRMSEGELPTDSKLEIELKEPFFNDSKDHWIFNGGIIQDIDIVTINGEKNTANFRFINNTTFNIIPKSPLQPNTSYKIEVDFATLAKKFDKKSSIKSVKMNFKTLPTQIHLNDLHISSEGVKNTIHATLELSQEIHLEKLTSAIRLENEEKQHFNLKIIKISQRLYSIESSVLIPSAEKDTTFNLIVDSKALGGKEVQTYPVVLLKNSTLALIDIRANEEEKTITLDFSQELAKTPNLNSFIAVAPKDSQTPKKLKFTASQVGNSIILSGDFSFSTPYSIDVQSGLSSVNGVKLQENITTEVVFKELPPGIAFSQSGVFLPSSAHKRIAFKTRNVKKVKLTLSKIYANNLTQFFYEENLQGSASGNNAKINRCKKEYDEEYDEYYEQCSYGLELDKIGDTLLQKEFSVTNEQNVWVQNEIDLSSIGDLSGIFIVELEFDKDGVDYNFQDDMSDWRIDNFFRNYARISKHLVFSNIALIAHQSDKKFTLTALDITKTTPLAGVPISAIDRKNQVVKRQTTNGNGEAIFENIDETKLLYFIAQRGNDTAILKPSSTLVSTEGFDIDGTTSIDNIRAYIYTERGVYRPGDSVFFNVIVRSDDKILDSAHPVFLSVKNPKGKSFLDKVPLVSASEGFYHYEMKTPKNADTGVWEATIKVGDSVFKKQLSVEAVVPNRIKVLINAPEILDLSNNTTQPTLNFDIEAAYLFGAPASELDYESYATLTSKEFKSKAYKDFIFSTPSTMRYYDSKYSEGKLDEKGKENGEIELDNIERINGILNVALTTKVIENNGRFALRRKNINVEFYKSFVGIKPPQSNYISVDKKVQIPVIVRSSDDKKLLANRNIHYTVYANQYSWWLDYDDQSEFLRSIKTDQNTKIVAQGSLKTKNIPVLFEYIPKQNGHFYIEFSDEENDTKAGISLYTSEFGDALDAQKITSLKIKTDKEKYQVGDNAKISFESIQNGKALVLISKENKVLSRYWVNTNAGKTELSIPISSNMLPNAYVSVVFLQNYNTQAQIDRSMRLYGVVPLMVETQSKLNYEINAPDSILPNTEFEVKLSTKEGIASTYTIAIVDEGLLNLTDFESPNPYKYFYSKIAFGLKMFDTYDLIIGKTFGKVHKVLKIGGDEEFENRQKNNEEAQRFKPVVLYNAPVKTDEHGNATLKFKMPSYLGSVRVMVAGANGLRYGKAEKNIKVSAPVVMLPTIPRTLKVGDTFSLPIELFPTTDSIKNVKVNVATQKGIVKFDKSTQNVKFRGKKPQNIIFEGKVENEVGVENILLSLSGDGANFNDSIEIDIKPINPYINTSKNFVLQADKKLEISAPQDFIKGSNNGFITLSPNPILNINHRIKWLMQYPYGCIEQTTSSAMPQLYLDKLSTFKGIDKKRIIENINSAISRIGGFVTPSGGFAYWQGGSKPDEWGTHYAGHFLILAKNLGYYVPDSILRGWIAYERNFVRNTNSSKAYALFLLALAKEPEIPVMNALYENNLKGLNVVDKWLLGAAYKLAGFEEQAKKIIKDIGIVPDSTKSFYEYSYGSKLRDEAMILQSYQIIYGKINEALFNNVLRALESDDWLSTQSTGYGLLSLINTQNSELKGNIKLKVNINGALSEIKLSDTSTQIPLDFGKATIESKSQAYVNFSWEGIPMGEVIKPIGKKMRIERTFFDENGNEINVKSLKSAQSFWIRLNVIADNNNTNVKNIALTQALPSGWEIENLRLNSADNLPEFIKQSNINSITYTDIRDDRIMWFFDMNYQKNQQVFAKINTVTPGSYTLPPAYAEAMYDNSYQAATKSEKVKVLAK